MKRTLVLLLLVLVHFCSNTASAQTIDYEVVRKVYLRVYAGASISRLNHDTLTLKAVTYPLGGMDMRYRFSDKASLLLGAEYALVGGREAITVMKLRNQYVRGYLMPRVQFENKMAISVGAGYAYLFKSEVKEVDGNSASGVTYTEIDDYDSQVEIAFGGELPLSNKADLGVMLLTPLTPSGDYTSFELSVRFHINY